ncbi:hypothetical protein HMPREF1141_3506 [Clostridium sp. MSTE9]|nr:hypothetical protein HMPREF1141_3506 [Clostridium sp. MSTE9]
MLMMILMISAFHWIDFLEYMDVVPFPLDTAFSDYYGTKQKSNSISVQSV